MDMLGLARRVLSYVSFYCGFSRDHSRSLALVSLRLIHLGLGSMNLHQSGLSVYPIVFSDFRLRNYIPVLHTYLVC